MIELLPYIKRDLLYSGLNPLAFLPVAIVRSVIHSICKLHPVIVDFCPIIVGNCKKIVDKCYIHERYISRIGIATQWVSF